MTMVGVVLKRVLKMDKNCVILYIFMKEREELDYYQL